MEKKTRPVGNFIVLMIFLQWFDTVGWVTGKSSGL